MIGIIGYGMVGKAVEFGFSKTKTVYSDPKYNSISVNDICEMDPQAIFVCVPTPTDDSNYSILKSVLDTIKDSGYTGLVVVKSTILPGYLEDYDIVYNPEFLSRSTANQDFVTPPMLVIGGRRRDELLELYTQYSDVRADKTFMVDVKTASLIKYIMNTFYAVKVTYMNEMYDIAQQLGIDWNAVAMVLANHPWMGTHHFQVPGPDGERGFGGPCLPKDSEALAKAFDVKLLNTVLELNKHYRP
jgi:UDPglucose 6-dehydrogenase